MPPPNDDFVNAVALPGTSGSLDGDNTGATAEAGEPLDPSSGPANSVWYAKTPASSGTLTLTAEPLPPFVTYSFPETDTVYLVYELQFDTPLITSAAYVDVHGFFQASESEADGLYLTPDPVWRDAASAWDDILDHLEPDTWHTIAHGYAADSALTIDGEDATFVGPRPGFTVDHVRLGFIFPAGLAGIGTLRIRNVKIGTTLGGNDLADAPAEQTFTVSTLFGASAALDVYTGAAVNALSLVGSDLETGSPVSVTIFLDAGATCHARVLGADSTIAGPFTLSWAFTPGVAPSIRLYDPPLWRGILTNLAGRTLTNLDSRAAERSFVFERNKPTSATGLVATDDPEINLPFPDLDSPARLSHNTRLIYWLRRESGASPPYVPRASGLVMQIEDVAADTPTARYTTFDSWQILMARPVLNPDTLLPTGATYTNQRGSDIALDLLANTVAVHGDVLIDASDLSRIHDTPVISGKTVFEPGLSVGEAWTRLTDTGSIDIYLKPIYDPSGRPGKLAELYIFPELGTIRYNAVFAWGMGPRNIMSLSRLIDGTRLANEVQFYAGDAKAPVPLQSDPASVAAFGEYWSQQFNVGASGQADLVELAALAELEQRRNGPRNISFNPAPERSPLVLRDYGLGDYLPVYLPRDLRAPLHPNLDYPPLDFQRAERITINLDDNGVEQVEIVAAGDAA